MKSVKLLQDYILESQSGAEMIFNEFVARLGAILGSVDSVSNTGVAADNNAYIVGASPTDDFIGYTNYIAVYHQRWIFVPPSEGMKVWVISSGSWLKYTSSSWVAL